MADMESEVLGKVRQLGWRAVDSQSQVKSLKGIEVLQILEFLCQVYEPDLGFELQEKVTNTAVKSLKKCLTLMELGHHAPTGKDLTAKKGKAKFIKLFSLMLSALERKHGAKVFSTRHFPKNKPTNNRTKSKKKTTAAPPPPTQTKDKRDRPKTAEEAEAQKMDDKRALLERRKNYRPANQRVPSKKKTSTQSKNKKESRVPLKALQNLTLSANSVPPPTRAKVVNSPADKPPQEPRPEPAAQAPPQPQSKARLSMGGQAWLEKNQQDLADMQADFDAMDKNHTPVKKKEHEPVFPQLDPTPRKASPYKPPQQQQQQQFVPFAMTGQPMYMLQNADGTASLVQVMPCTPMQQQPPMPAVTVPTPIRVVELPPPPPVVVPAVVVVAEPEPEPQVAVVVEVEVEAVEDLSAKLSGLTFAQRADHFDNAVKSKQARLADIKREFQAVHAEITRIHQETQGSYFRCAAFVDSPSVQYADMQLNDAKKLLAALLEKSGHVMTQELREQREVLISQKTQLETEVSALDGKSNCTAELSNYIKRAKQLQARQDELTQQLQRVLYLDASSARRLQDSRHVLAKISACLESWEVLRVEKTKVPELRQ